MTATTLPRGTRAAGTRSGRPRLGRVVPSEWTKLASLRSPWWTAVVTVAVAWVITYLQANASSVDPGFEPMDSLGGGLLLAQLGPLVLGVLVGAGEFRTGAFRTTFTTVPRRLPVLAAQTVVMAAFGAGLGVLVAAAGVVAILPSARSRDIALDLTADGTPALLVATVLFVAGLALLGLALGALVRRTVPAMMTALFLVVILPIALMLATDPLVGGADPASMGAADPGTTVVGTLGALTPGTAGQLMMTPASSGPMDGAPDLGPVGAGLVFGAWILVLLVAAAVRLRTRDVR
jgi:ABC-2 type transport system permease protein